MQICMNETVVVVFFLRSGCGNEIIVIAFKRVNFFYTPLLGECLALSYKLQRLSYGFNFWHDFLSNLE